MSEQHYRRTLPETLAKVTGQTGDDAKAKLAAMFNEMTPEQAAEMIEMMEEKA